MNYLTRTESTSSRQGFSMIEAMLTLSVFGIVLTGLMKSFGHFTDMTEQSSREFQAQAQTLRALDAVADELARSAYITLGGVDYPVFVEGNAVPALPAEFMHAAPDQSEGSGLLSNDVQFVLPQDADGDSWPDLDANRDPIWSPVVVSFVLVPDGEGTNTLERRTTAGDQRVVARRVASIRFQDPAAANWEIPLETVRIQIEIAMPDERGATLTRRAESVVRLNNGIFVP